MVAVMVRPQTGLDIKRLGPEGDWLYEARLRANGRIVGHGRVEELLYLDHALARGIPAALMWLGLCDRAVQLVRRRRMRPGWPGRG